MSRVWIRFVREFEKPNGSRHRVGAHRHEPEHVAAAFCDGDDPFAVVVECHGGPEVDPPASMLRYMGQTAEVEEVSGDDLADLTVDELKDLLRDRDLKVSGTKGELIARLEGAE